MGCNAEIKVIGPYGVLRDSGVLDYGSHWYKSPTDELPVLGTLAAAGTTDESETLAFICGVDLYDAAWHIITTTNALQRMANDGACHCNVDDFEQVYDTLCYLVAREDCLVFFLPEG